MDIEIRYSILFFNFFPPFQPQFLNPAEEQINQSHRNHGNPNICPPEKISTNNAESIVRISAESSFKKHSQSHNTPADEEKYPPQHNRVMSALTMSEKLRKVITQKIHPYGKINKKYCSCNVFQKISERKRTCRIKCKYKHNRNNQ